MNLTIQKRVTQFGYLARFTTRFLAPASGKTHLAATIRSETTMRKGEKSWRIGVSPQKERIAATISTRAERMALRSLGRAAPAARASSRRPEPPPLHRAAA